MKKSYLFLILAIVFTLNAVAQNIPNYIPKDGLVGYWPFNGNANDESGNGNNGTVNGATLTADRNGKANSAYSFDGNSYINCGSSSILNCSTGLTLSFWGKTIVNYGNCGPVGKWNNNGKYGEEQYVTWFTSNTVSASIRSDNFSYKYANGNFNYSDGKWHIYTITYDQFNAKVYIDDKLITKEAQNGLIPEISQSLLIGVYSLGIPTEKWNGQIDDIAIYNRALTEQEITALYYETPLTQNIPSYVQKDGLVGYWPFNGNANDESGNGNNGTVNGATLTADRNGNANSAYSFDGNSYINCGSSSILNCSTGLTLSFWGKTIVNYGNCGPVGKWNNNGKYGEEQYVTWFTSNTVSASIRSDNFSYKYANGNFNYSDGKWHIYTITYDQFNAKVYIDGKLITKEAQNGLIPEISQSLLIGVYSLGIPTEKWNGQIDDIAIYNRALNEQEISQLYAGCTKETATSSSFNSLLFTNGNAITVTAEPQGGVFTGTRIENNQFIPAKAKIGSNKVKYNFKNSQGCADSTIFTMVVADTVGTSCTKFDTVIVNKTKYDTVIVKTNVFDTVKVNKTIYDTITIKNNVYDTITVTNNVTKYDTVIVNKTNYDTVSVLKIKFKLTTGLSANQLSSLSIFPNPTSDILHIETTDAKALDGYRYRILDALGKVVYNELVTQTTTEIPLKTLGAAGIYQFEVLDANNVSIQSNKIVLY